VTVMAFIETVTLEVADPTAADHFYTTAFGLDTQIRLRASEAPTIGFRGFALALTVSQPATVNGLIEAALDSGATTLKPAAKSLWGYGGVVQAPDGTIWKVATSTKKDTGPATRQIDEIVLLPGVADVVASKRRGDARSGPGHGHASPPAVPSEWRDSAPCSGAGGPAEVGEGPESGSATTWKPSRS
jgi:catechol 2,3-dioxygenase-like lactoylglutathione lyase family enzyme